MDIITLQREHTMQDHIIEQLQKALEEQKETIEQLRKLVEETISSENK